MLNLTIKETIFNSKKRRRRRVQNALIAAGVSQAAIARQFNVTPSMISMVIAGKARSTEIEKFINEITGKQYF